MTRKGPDAPGVYLLLLHLTRARRIEVGRLGPVSFPAGFYLYAGSGRRGLRARLERHRWRAKRLRWHIDYLRRRARLVAAVVTSWAPGRECALARSALGLPGARAVAKGFGASDCTCLAHLAYLGRDHRPVAAGAPAAGGRRRSTVVVPPG